ncbi:protein kinase domain-containing protein [Cystobacter ferrugineus]|uniref:Protein kinase n=1 Tax=Cystobacter ferrugineus TaxID=83449 RepID=A0A1L9B1K4_9BACT|nr:protein kinase [Cystobacter ferrugineus]OJH36141.1 protein kinase [Cystobacter ferrugineus]
MATYRLIRKLAAGGMAEVFLAKVVGAEGSEKPVAVKRLLPSMARDREFVELFLREARLTVCLQHPNVAQVFDLGALEGQYYMVMELVDGENLRALQRRAAARGLLLGLREVCFIVQQIAEGLAYAHGRVDAAGRPLNIIHRDVNPSNVLVSSRGEVKLADFGIAKAINAQSGTQVGVVKGRAGYLAPEQVKGAEVDQRADLFLTGLLLYELLAGRQLFQGTDYFQTLRAIAQFDVKRLVPLPGVPAALWSIITRALAPEPAARFHQARELSDALRDFLFEHRLRVGTQDVAVLFQRCFPGRRSLLEGVDGGSPEALGEEIRLGAEVGLQRPTPLTSVRSRPPFLGGPRPGTPAPARAQTEPGRVPVAAPPSSTSILEMATRVMRPARRKLGEMLLVFGKVSEPQLQGALERQRSTGGRIGELLVAEGLLSEEDVVRALSEQSGTPFISDRMLRTMPVPRLLLPLLPLEKAERLEAIPVSQQAGELVCAMREPRDPARLDELKLITGHAVRGIYATQSALRHAIGRFYRGEAVERAGESFQRLPPAGLEPRQEGATSSGPSMAGVLGQEAGSSSRAARWHSRVVDAALAMLGGAGAWGSVLASLARDVAGRLGAAPSEAESASAVAYALALAAFQESGGRFARPSCEAVRAILGRDSEELAGLIDVCARNAPPPLATAPKAVLALATAVAFLEEAGPIPLGASDASQVLVRLRAAGRLPTPALEALSGVLAESNGVRAPGPLSAHASPATVASS